MLAAILAPAVRSQDVNQIIQAFREAKYEQAAEMAKSWAHSQPQDPTAHHLYGLALGALKRFPEAEAELRRAIELSPKDAGLHNDYGAVLLRAGEPSQAMSAFEEAVRLEPEYWMARLQLGRLYHNAGRTDDAFGQFQKIAAAEPDFPGVHYHLAKIHLHRGEGPQALEELRREVAVDNSNLQARLEMAEVLIQLNQPSEALEQLSIVHQGDPRADRLFLLFAKAYRDTDQTQKALQAARQEVDAHPEGAPGYYLLAQLLQQAGRAEEASAAMERFQKLSSQEGAVNPPE